MEDREYYARLLYLAATHDPHSGIATIILNVAAQLCCDNAAVDDAFRRDVQNRSSNNGK